MECAIEYDRQGADELVLLDITASSDDRNIMVDIVSRVAESIFIPFTVGGGIRTVEDFTQILRAGADKVSVNSAALKNPGIIREAAEKFGSQCVVVAMDAKRRPEGGLDPVLKRRQDRHGQGRPGVGPGGGAPGGRGDPAHQHGLRRHQKRLRSGIDPGGVSQAVGIPVIASGGAGKLEHFYDAFVDGGG